MDSLHWLLPKFTVPTWLDGLIAIMICLVGWLIQRFIIKNYSSCRNIFKRSSAQFSGKCPCAI